MKTILGFDMIFLLEKASDMISDLLSTDGRKKMSIHLDVYVAVDRITRQ